jgi:hypothetical protein
MNKKNLHSNNFFKEHEYKDLKIPSGRFYGPCSGQDLNFAFRLFAETIKHFVFCDLSYRGRSVSAKNAVPNDWSLISRDFSFAQKSEKKTWYSGNRAFRPSVITELWKRPDGLDVIVELRRDLAEEVLVEQFEIGSIAAFMHINDGTSEGGSDLWFMASPLQQQNDNYRSQFLLPKVAQRLVKGAVVVTDGVMAHSGFKSYTPFVSENVKWKPLGKVENNNVLDRQPSLWRMC